MSQSDDISIEDDTAEAVQEDIAESDDDVTGLMRLGAGAQLAFLFLSIIGTLIGGVYFGYINPDLTLVASVNVGWVLEYLIVGISAAIVIYIFALVLIVLPGSVLNAIAGIAYGIASAGGYIDDEE
jgi:uncharacterized membrane protein YdjX (TVP38/TMEM64 family)